MLYLTVKYLLTAGMVVLVSELAKRSDKFGALLAAMPLMTLLTLIWLYLEQQSDEKIQNHAWLTFWYVLPTLPMFLAFPWLFSRLSFWLSLIICALLCAFCFFVLSVVLHYFDIRLL